MIKNRLIFMIQGNYYVMDYPGIDDTRQLLKQVCEDDLWKDAKSKGGASMRAMIKIRESKEMMSIHLDEWITDPFLVYHWTRPYQKYLLKSSGNQNISTDIISLACSCHQHNLICRTMFKCLQRIYDQWLSCQHQILLLNLAVHPPALPAGKNNGPCSYSFHTIPRPSTHPIALPA